MPAQPTNPQTPRSTHAAITTQLDVTAPVNMQHVGICTRGMAKKTVVNAAAASLRAAKVLTQQRTFTRAFVAAACAAIITSISPQRKAQTVARADTTPKAIGVASKIIEAAESIMAVGAWTIEEQMREMMNKLEQVMKDNEEANAISNPIGGDSSSCLRCAKPYTRRINGLPMPQGYQPPKFQLFDGQGNLKQHIAHFMETCNNAGTDDDLLVKQFVRSLKEIAFDWYTDLEPESIDSWEQMEEEFLNRFYSTRRIVSMSELTSAKQWEDELVVNYINR